MALRRSRRAPGELPQYSEIWHVAIHELRTWIAPEDEEPYRPFVVAVLNLEVGFLQLMEISPGLPTPEQVLKMLMKAIKKPDKKSGQEPHRPQQIRFENSNQLKRYLKSRRQLRGPIPLSRLKLHSRRKGN